MLARRDYARAELERRLGRRGFDAAAVAQALDDLERRGFLSDARVAAGTVERMRGRAGRRAIEHELRQRGIAPAARADALVQVDARDEFADAWRLWSKRFGHPPADQRERARQCRFLIARGYTTETALRVLRGEGDRAPDGDAAVDPETGG